MLILRITPKTVSLSITTRNLIVLLGLFLASGRPYSPSQVERLPAIHNEIEAVRTPVSGNPLQAGHQGARKNHPKAVVAGSTPVPDIASSSAVLPDRILELEILQLKPVSGTKDRCSSQCPTPGFVRTVINETNQPGKPGEALLKEEEKGTPGSTCGAVMPKR